MKKGLLALLLLTGLFANKALAQPCALTNVTVNVYTSGGSCYADISYDMDRNNGNKYIYIHLWNDAEYADVNTARWQKGAGPKKADIDGSGNSHPSLATIAIDNNNYSNPVFSSLNYRPDGSVTAKKGTSVTSSATPVSGSGSKAYYRYTITKVLLGAAVAGGCTNSNVNAIVWSTQANSINSHIHCAAIGAAPARTLEISGSANCSSMNYTLTIDNNTNNSVSGNYNIYADNGAGLNDGAFDPNTDTQIDNGVLSISKGQSLTVTRAIPSAYLGYNLFAQVVLSDGTTQVVQLTTTACPATPNLTPTIQYLPSITHGTQTVTVLTTVAETKGVSTNGTITVYVARDPKYTITYPASATTVGGNAVNNSTWTLDNTNAQFYIFRRTSTINGMGSSRFGFSLNFNPNNSNGATTITAFIAPNSGGELSADANDNTDNDVLIYFLQ